MPYYILYIWFVSYVYTQVEKIVSKSSTVTYTVYVIYLQEEHDDRASEQETV